MSKDFIETDIWGNKVIRHEDGSKSRMEKDIWGNEVIRHSDGTTTWKETSFFGEEYYQHSDGSSSKRDTDIFGNDIIRHSDGSKSYIEKDIWGNNVIRHPDGSTRMATTAEIKEESEKYTDKEYLYYKNGGHYYPLHSEDYYAKPKERIIRDCCRVIALLSLMLPALLGTISTMPEGAAGIIIVALIIFYTYKLGLPMLMGVPFSVFYLFYLGRSSKVALIGCLSILAVFVLIAIITVVFNHNLEISYKSSRAFNKAATASVVTGSIVGIFLGIRSWAFSGPNDDIASNLGWNLFDRFFQNLGWLLLPIAIGIVFYAIFKRMSHSHYNRRA